MTHTVYQLGEAIKPGHIQWYGELQAFFGPDGPSYEAYDKPFDAFLQEEWEYNRIKTSEGFDLYFDIIKASNK